MLVHTDIFSLTFRTRYFVSMFECECVCVCVWEREREREREFCLQETWVSACDLWSISSTFYAGIFYTNVLSYFRQSQNITREKLPKRLSYKKGMCKTLMILTPGLNFINVLSTSFMHAKPKSVKKTVKSSVSFYAFGIYVRKSCTKNIDEIDTWKEKKCQKNEMCWKKRKNERKRKFKERHWSKGETSNASWNIRNKRRKNGKQIERKETIWKSKLKACWR